MQVLSSELPEHYCYYAFQGYSTHPHGRTRPCCFSREDTTTFMPSVDVTKYPMFVFESEKFKKAENINDFINDERIMAARKALLNGEKPNACKECFNLEKNGIRSFRQTFNEIYEKDIDKTLSSLDPNTGYLNSKAITYLDISLGNVCNLKCRSCNPWASHRWLEEGPTVPHTDWDHTAYVVGEMSSKDPWFIEAFKTGFFDSVLPNVKVINFIGGEPLVVTEHYDWLEHIISQGWSSNIELHYNTNGTTIPKRLLDIWDKFKGVVLSLSIDAVGNLAYYVRYPSKWKIIEKNVQKLVEFSKTRTGVIVHTHVTLSMLNLHDLPNVLDWCKNNYDTWHYKWDWGNHGYQNCLPHFNIVNWPRWLHIRNLPEKQKSIMNNMLEEQYNKFSNYNLPEWEKHSIENIKNLKNLLNEPVNNNDWKIFIDNTRASDSFRNVNIKNYIEWMKDYI